MPSEIIQWFPGHMAKAERMMKEMLPQIDMIIEIADSRIPISSRNPDLRRIAGSKPILTVFSKSSLADPESSKRWKAKIEAGGGIALFIDSQSGSGIKEIPLAVKELMSEKLAKYASKGMVGKPIRVMIAGIPNVGKSSLINKLAGGKRTNVEDRPGVTRDKQWITTSLGIELLDTPGVLWPKLDKNGDQTVGENLALTGAIRDEILDAERMAVVLCGRLRKKYPSLLSERYKLPDMESLSELADWELFETIGRKRGFLISGGEVSYERTAVMLLDEFRGGRIGRITLEEPS